MSGTVVTGAGIERIRVFVAKQALAVHVKTDGAMELTRGGTRAAVAVIAEYTGKTYRGKAGKREALDDAEALLAAADVATKEGGE